MPTSRPPQVSNCTHWKIQYNTITSTTYARRYANHFSDPEETIKYVYRPRLVPGLDNTVIERRYSEIGDKRQKILRSGIGIEVVFTGTFEKFSFITLMGTIVAGAYEYALC